MSHIPHRILVHITYNRLLLFVVIVVVVVLVAFCVQKKIIRIFGLDFDFNAN